MSCALACEDGPAPHQPNNFAPSAFSQLLSAHVIASEVTIQAQYFYFIVASPEGDHVDGSGAFERSSKGWTRGLCHAEGRLGSVV